jgi:hypothetical protein
MQVTLNVNDRIVNSIAAIVAPFADHELTQSEKELVAYEAINLELQGLREGDYSCWSDYRLRGLLEDVEPELEPWPDMDVTEGPRPLPRRSPGTAGGAEIDLPRPQDSPLKGGILRAIPTSGPSQARGAGRGPLKSC